MNFHKSILALLPILVTSQLFSTTIYVNQSASGANNGTTRANAFIELGEALSNANPKDEIWIAAGTYLPNRDENYNLLAIGNRHVATFMLPQEVHVYGGFNGTETLLSQRDPSVNIIILSGDHLGNDNGNLSYTNPLLVDNSFTVVTASNLNNGELLDGFHIVKGAAIPNNSYTPFPEYLNGAGLYAKEQCQITIVNFIIIRYTKMVVL